MRLRDGTVLMHAAPYDPVKAHEYYMRTRQLKGYKTGRKTLPQSTPSRRSGIKSPTYTVKTPSGKAVKLTRTELDQQVAYAARRVAEIKKSLVELGTKLRKMTAEAKKKETQTKREANKKPTAAEQSKDAKASEQYRKEHRQELKNKAKQENAKKTTTEKDPVVALENKIAQIKGRLSAAVAKQRALIAASKNS